MNSASPGLAPFKLVLFFILILWSFGNEASANGESEVDAEVGKRPMLCPPLVCACNDVDRSANCSNRGFLSMPPALPTVIRMLDLSYNDLESVNSSELTRLSQLETLDVRYEIP